MPNIICYICSELKQFRGSATCALSEGKAEEALKLFTEAIELNPHAASLFAKRAQFFVGILVLTIMFARSDTPHISTRYPRVSMSDLSFYTLISK